MVVEAHVRPLLNRVLAFQYQLFYAPPVCSAIVNIVRREMPYTFPLSHLYVALFTFLSSLPRYDKSAFAIVPCSDGAQKRYPEHK